MKSRSEAQASDKIHKPITAHRISATPISQILAVSPAAQTVSPNSFIRIPSAFRASNSCPQPAQHPSSVQKERFPGHLLDKTRKYIAVPAFWESYSAEPAAGSGFVFSSSPSLSAFRAFCAAPSLCRCFGVTSV